MKKLGRKAAQLVWRLRCSCSSERVTFRPSTFGPYVTVSREACRVRGPGCEFYTHCESVGGRLACPTCADDLPRPWT